MRLIEAVLKCMHKQPVSSKNYGIWNSITIHLKIFIFTATYIGTYCIFWIIYVYYTCTTLIAQIRNISCHWWVWVPCSINLTGKRDNAGHKKTTVNESVIIILAIFVTDTTATNLKICCCFFTHTHTHTHTHTKHMEGPASARINDIAFPKHREEEETPPNRNNIITI